MVSLLALRSSFFCLVLIKPNKDSREMVAPCVPRYKGEKQRRNAPTQYSDCSRASKLKTGPRIEMIGSTHRRRVEVLYRLHDTGGKILLPLNAEHHRSRVRDLLEGIALDGERSGSRFQDGMLVWDTTGR